MADFTFTINLKLTELVIVLKLRLWSNDFYCWLCLRETEIENKKKEKAWASSKLREMQDRYDGQPFFFGNSSPSQRSLEFYTKGKPKSWSNWQKAMLGLNISKHLYLNLFFVDPDFFWQYVFLTSVFEILISICDRKLVKSCTVPSSKSLHPALFSFSACLSYFYFFKEICSK